MALTKPVGLKGAGAGTTGAAGAEGAVTLEVEVLGIPVG